MASFTNRALARMLRTRWLMRIPIGLFRARLGWIFGGRLVMIEHRGRTTGERRFVVLECAERPRPDVVLVPSGLGPRSQWYRNLEANGVAFVSIGIRFRVPAEVRLLDERESAERLIAYGQRHPAAWARLREAMAVAQKTEHPVIPIAEFSMRH
jgi:deazaflavin-dependent oxidoreductase (nitroreductase family)